MAKYSVLEASKILNLTKQTIVNRIKRGELEGSKDESGQWIVEIADYEVPNGYQKAPNDDQIRYQEVPNHGDKVPNQDQNRYQRVPNDGQEVPNQEEEHKERRPRRENDDALLENNKFLQLTTASNQELVARLTKSIDEQKSRESKAWIASAIIFGTISLIIFFGLIIYFTDQTTKIKEESKSIRDEMKLEHQSEIKSYEDTIEKLGTKHQDAIKSMEIRYLKASDNYQIMYQSAKKDYQIRYQEVSDDYQKKEGILQDQIDLLKTQNKELMELLKTSRSANLSNP